MLQRVATKEEQVRRHSVRLGTIWLGMGGSPRRQARWSAWWMNTRTCSDATSNASGRFVAHGVAIVGR